MKTNQEERKELETAIYDAKAFLGGIYYEARINRLNGDIAAMSKAQSDLNKAAKHIEELEIELKILEGTFGKY